MRDWMTKYLIILGVLIVLFIILALVMLAYDFGYSRGTKKANAGAYCRGYDDGQKATSDYYINN